MKFFIKDSFSKCDQIWSSQPTWSHLLEISLMESSIICAVWNFDVSESQKGICSGGSGTAATSKLERIM